MIARSIIRGLDPKVGLYPYYHWNPVAIQKAGSRDRSRGIRCRSQVAFVPQLSFESDTQADYVDIDGVLIASMGQHTRKRLYESTKRAFDLVAAVALVVISSPLWAVLAILIRRDSMGPVLFSQTRVGRDGRLFKLFKFRSMHINAPKYDLHPTDTNDPRVTRFGFWLRKTESR